MVSARWRIVSATGREMEIEMKIRMIRATLVRINGVSRLADTGMIVDVDAQQAAMLVALGKAELAPDANSPVESADVRPTPRPRK